MAGEERGRRIAGRRNRRAEELRRTKESHAGLSLSLEERPYPARVTEEGDLAATSPPDHVGWRRRSCLRSPAPGHRARTSSSLWSGRGAALVLAVVGAAVRAGERASVPGRKEARMPTDLGPGLEPQEWGLERGFGCSPKF